MTRKRMQTRIGGTMKTLEAIFSYPAENSFDDYMYMYRRTGPGKRIINAIVDFTWKNTPIITENDELYKQIEALNKNHAIFKMLKRADVLACIGRYSVLVINTKNGKPMEALKNADGIDEITFLSVYSEKQATIAQWDANPNSPRYGLPDTYKINVQGVGTNSISHTVHHSRVIHIADELLDSDVYGTPKLEPVYNYIQDLMKIVGGSAEMFWRGAYQGLVFNVDPEKLMPDEALADIEARIEEKSVGMERNTVVSGVAVQPLPSVTPDPSRNVDTLIQLIASGRGIPARIFWGSEQGQLASSTDRDMFLSMIAGRREDFAEDAVLKVLIDRLMESGFLTKGDYEIEWQPLIEQTADEKISNADKLARIGRTVVGSAGEVTQIFTREEIREEAGFEPEPPDTNFQPQGDYSHILAELPMYDEPKYNNRKRKRKRRFGKWGRSR